MFLFMSVRISVCWSLHQYHPINETRNQKVVASLAGLLICKTKWTKIGHCRIKFDLMFCVVQRRVCL